jgi:nucleoside 2-deoxyribosyltransferase
MGFNCPFCGKYAITEECSLFHRDPNPIELSKIACYVKERTLRGLPFPVFFSQTHAAMRPGAVSWDAAIEAFPKTPADRLDRALLNLSHLTNHLGQQVDLPDYAKSAVFALNEDEVEFIFNALREDGLLRYSAATTGIIYWLTAKGFNRVADLERGGPLSKQVFVAMHFDPLLADVYEKGIKTAIEEDCGYKSFRVDREQHNEDINDKIIAEMRKSKFMVADFTDNRPGVYFEAGFMMGLGRTVIFSCKEDKLVEVHFDTSHRNHVLWNEASDFREKLKLRIQATIVP